MIAMLRGRVAAQLAGALVLDVHGVGYRVGVPASLLAAPLPGDQELTLHVSTLVREDDIALYGFRTTDERDAFDLLREVNGIGPKLALAILSNLELGPLSVAIHKDDVRSLSRIPGVGAKIAQRLCLELKTKLPERFVPAASTAAEADALPLALARMEFRKSEIDRALAEVPAAGEATFAERFSAALRVLRPQ